MEPFAARRVADAYDTVAENYAEAFADDLLKLPLDRAVLDDLLAAMATGQAGPVLDLGCGPGQVGQYLMDGGARVVGADLAPQMLAAAGRRTRLTALVCADMRALPFAPGSLAGVVAFYSVQHVPRSDLGVVLAEARSALAQGGILVLAVHLGDGEVFVEDFLGHRIEPVGGTLYQRPEVEAAVVGHGFTIESARERGPLPHEHQSRRIYLLARKADHERP